MFLQLRKGSDNSGVILIIVMIILLVMATFSVGIFSQSMSQTKTSRSQVDDIVAEQLAKGVFFSSYNSQDVESGVGINHPQNSNGVTYNLNGRIYTVNTLSVWDPTTNLYNTSFNLGY